MWYHMVSLWEALTADGRKVLLFLLLLVAFLCLPGGCDRREDEVSEAMLRDIGPPGYDGWVERPYDPNVDKWSVVTPPAESDWEAYGVFLRMVNESDCEWVVRRENGRVVAHRDSGRERMSSVSPAFDTTAELTQARIPGTLFAKVDDGWIVGYDAGEFGAAVYWFSETGRRREKLSDHQIQQFLVEGDRLFAVEGLDHLMSSGSMVELRKEGEKWLCEEFICLPEAGKCIARVAFGDYIVVTSSMLLRVNLKREISILIPRVDWLHASSVALGDDGFVYVGSRHLVVRCKLGRNVQDVEYLVPDESWLEARGR